MKSLIDYLDFGRENARSRKYLCETTGMRDRDLRREIEMLRIKGYPILSNSENGGYYLPDKGIKGRNETTHFVCDMASRIRRMERVIHGVICGFRDMKRIDEDEV